MLTITASDFVQEQFSRLPLVACISLEQNGFLLYVTIVVDRFDDEALDAILDAEQKVMAEFADLGFDFNIVFQNGRPIRELIAPLTPLYERR